MSFALGAAIAAATARADALPVATPFSVDPLTVVSGPPIDGNADSPAWKAGTHLTLGWDLHFQRPAPENTDVYLLDDAKYLYVGFVAEQHDSVRATQHTDEVGFDTDDEVQVDLWPGGPSGFRYLFTVTPLGTHYSHSTENSNYAPTWQSAGHLTRYGYEVTMRIPLSAMRGDGRTKWHAQFIRFEQQTGAVFEWSHQPQQQNHNDVIYSGLLAGMQSAGAGTRTKPRLAVYSLASLASAHAGGSTSRAGADWAAPVTPTASFIGTVHPDYSNVDLDQQTIAPTAFARFFQEVRPFFTQGANFYNPFDCIGCPGIQELYTPAIPTPRTGYALEGTQAVAGGTASFGAFDAVGAGGRTDAAQSFSLTNAQRADWLEFQRVSSDQPGIHDDVDTASVEYADHRHFFTYATYGQDRGTLVLDPGQAQRREFGASVFGPKWSVGGALRSVGSYYSPLDGIVQHPDIAGYEVNFDRSVQFAPTSAITGIEAFGILDRYQGRTGGQDQSDQAAQLNVYARDNFTYEWSTGSSYVRFAATPYAPVTQQGPLIGYKMHSSTPSEINLNEGRFGDGKLLSWVRITTLPVGSLGTLQFEGDDTQYGTPATRLTQWLEKATLSLQLGRDASFALGVRRIIGTAPPLFAAPAFTDASNVSLAYHRRLPHDELYLVYGDPNVLSTTPAFIIKFVHYFGADKGT